MRELLEKLDAEYGFRLSAEEKDRIEKEVKEAERLFQQINEVDISGKTPFMRLDVKGDKQ
jgi:Asp-tRNA(Asn)/Glu-tRNA(Gln) amidotransferase C subunit